MTKNASGAGGAKTSGDKASGVRSSGTKRSRKSAGTGAGKGSGSRVRKSKCRDLVYLATPKAESVHFVEYTDDSAFAWVEGHCRPIPRCGDRLLTRMTDDSIQVFGFTGKRRRRTAADTWVAQVVYLPKEIT